VEVNRDEKGLWQLVKPHLPGTAERIENVVGAGIPDVSGAAAGCDYWVELKVCRTKRPKTPDEICEPLQVQWHKRRQKHGSTVFVLIRTGVLLALWRYTTGGYGCVWQQQKPWGWGLFTSNVVSLLGR
jgi:hypothetical protein